MGQRLVISNRINGQEVNNIYYHWSAYTLSAIDEVNSLCEYVVKWINENRNDIFLKMRSMYNDKIISPTDLFNLACYNAVSGIPNNDQKSLKYISEIGGNPNNKQLNRNEGLIAFSQAGREDSLYWSEGTLPINWAIEGDQLDLHKTTFDLSELVIEIKEEGFMDWFENEDLLKELKSNPKTIQLKDLPILSAKTIADQLPDMWYDAKQDSVFLQIR